MPYSWKFYLLKAHLTDENKHTACNRQLPIVDEPVGEVADNLKCETCKKYFNKYGLKFIVTKEGKTQ